MAKFVVILPAAGKSNRFRDKEKKPFANMDGRAVWLRSAELFVTRSDVSQCLIIVAKEDQETFRRRYGANITQSENTDRLHSFCPHIDFFETIQEGEINSRRRPSISAASI